MSFVDKILLPGGGRKYSGTNSKGLIWLTNTFNLHFPIHFIKKSSPLIILYSHGNGGSLGDFKHIVSYYSNWFNTSICAVEYPSYGPAEGDASEDTVNDNVITTFKFIVDVLGYPIQNIILMGYSIGTGPTIKIAADLCDQGTPPGAVVTVAAFLSICDIVRDLQKGFILSFFADAIANRWNSGEAVKRVTCPIMHVHGMLDDIIPYTHSEKLFHSCPSSKKRLRLVPMSDHIHFEEPVDTVQPISYFLKEFCDYDSPFTLNPIPPEYFNCPERILEYEKSVKKGSDIILDSAREGCSVLDNVFSWLIETSTAVASNTGEVIVNSSQNIQNLGLMSLGDALSFTSFNPIENDGMSKPPEGDNHVVNESEIDKIHRDYAGTPEMGMDAPQHLVMPSPSKASPLFQRSNEVKAPPITDESPVTSSKVLNASSTDSTDSIGRSSNGQSRKVKETKAAAKDSTLILSKFFEALNKHDVSAMIQYIDKDIQIHYSSDPSKNWSSLNVAVQYYTKLFNDKPDYKAKFVINKVVTEEIITSLKCSCTFTSALDNSHEKVNVVFVISRMNKIIVMDVN